MAFPEEEALLAENEFFILRTARIVTGRNISKSDDEWSIALSAFWEAEKNHSAQKGTLQAYASVVIRHRLIDYARKVRTHERETAVDPAVFAGNAEEASVAIQREVERSLRQAAPQTALAEEIEDLAETLKAYGINFFDLPKCCPKARKTRNICLKAARFVCRITGLLARLRRTLKLPAAEMEKGVPIARKLLDQFRKYIITSVEIEAGDFPGLQEYLAGKGEA